MYEHLRASGERAILTRDPGGTPLGEKIREILLDPANHNIDALTELFLYLAIRRQLVREVISPALDAGKIVISERFQTSAEVYQGYAGGLPIEKVVEMGKLACEGLVPDLAIILDIDAQAGLARRGKVLDRVEQKGKEFHEKVRRGFLEAANKDGNFKVVSAERPIEEVAAEIRNLVKSVL